MLCHIAYKYALRASRERVRTLRDAVSYADRVYTELVERIKRWESWADAVEAVHHANRSSYNDLMDRFLFAWPAAPLDEEHKPVDDWPIPVFHSPGSVALEGRDYRTTEGYRFDSDTTALVELPARPAAPARAACVTFAVPPPRPEDEEKMEKGTAEEEEEA
jgi:hypothetical protein